MLFKSWLIESYHYFIKNRYNMKNRTYFLTGDVVNLRKPDVSSDVLNGNWHKWFCDYQTTQYLEHGVFPISRDEQSNFVANELSKKDSLLLAIDNAQSNEHIGLINLKNINFIQRSAEVSLVIGEKAPTGGALEAMSLITSHGFERLNLLKIYAGQHASLWKWVNTLALIGYTIEGYRKSMGYRGGKSYDFILTGITSEDYFQLKELRGGSLLGGEGAAKLVKKRNRTNYALQLKDIIQEFNEKSFKFFTL